MKTVGDLAMNKKLAILLVGVFALGSAAGVKAESYLESIQAYLDHGIRLVLHGEEFIPKDVQGNEVIPIHYKGSTYLPIRGVAEAVGLPVKWDGETRTATVGFEKLQLNNFTETSFVDIQVHGNWKPSYLTPTRKQYSDEEMGVIFEIRPMPASTMDETVSELRKELDSQEDVKVLSVKELEKERYTGQVIEYETYFTAGEPETYERLTIIPSTNSEEVYLIQVYTDHQLREANMEQFDEIVSSFRKQK